jgi:CBS domain containing-hemolysin-like protein
MVLQLVATVALVLANAYFVVVEFSLTRLRTTQADEFAEQRRPGAKSVLHGVRRIDAYLSACQLGITMASLGLGVIGEEALHELFEPVFGDDARIFSVGVASLLAFLIVTMLHVVVGELAPKSFAIARTQAAVLTTMPFMRVFYFVTRPVVDLFNGMGNLLLKPFGIPPAREAGHSPHSEDELMTLLRQSQQQGVLEPTEGALSQRALTFDDRRVREIMVPRARVELLTTADSLDEAVALALRSTHQRLPLVEGPDGLDRALGQVHVKDVLAARLRGGPTDLRALAQPLARVSDGVVLSEVLRELQAADQHMALVVDEHGTAVGLVTIEDLVEELVGEIGDRDERDEDLIREDGQELVLEGEAPLRSAGERMGVDLDDAGEATVGGHIVELLGRLPEVGERVSLDGHVAEVLAVDEARVTQVRVRPLGEHAEAGE